MMMAMVTTERDRHRQCSFSGVAGSEARRAEARRRNKVAHSCPPIVTRSLFSHSSIYHCHVQRPFQVTFVWH